MAVRPTACAARPGPGSGRPRPAARPGSTAAPGAGPRATSASLRATSASVPPRCTVPASRQGAASQGTGPDSAQSTLQTPGPYRKRRQRLAVPARHRLAGDGGELPRRDVEQHGPGRRQAVQGADPAAGLDPAAQRRQLGDQGVDQPGAAALDQRPARPRARSCMSVSPKPPVPGAVSGSMACAATPASSAARLLGAEPPGQQARGQHAVQAEPGHGDRVPGHRPHHRGEQLGQRERHVADQRAEQPPVGRAVGAQAAGGLARPSRPRTRRARRPAGGRTRPSGAAACTPRPARSMPLEERRGGGQRVHRRAHVVPEAGQGELLRPAAAAGRGRPLDDVHRRARPGPGSPPPPARSGRRRPRSRRRCGSLGYPPGIRLHRAERTLIARVSRLRRPR